MAYEPHQQRVVDERSDLDTKIEKLHAFITSEKFDSLVDQEEASRMMRQRSSMKEYSSILGERIAAFTSIPQ